MSHRLDPYYRRLYATLGCNNGKVMLAALLFICAGPLEPHSWTRPMVEYPLYALLAAFYYVLIRARHEHDRHICLGCAADLPLNPGQEAERYRRWLKAFHDIGTSRGVIWVAGFGILMLLDIAFLPHVLASLIFVVGLAATMLLLMRTANMHRQLQLWCPYCHRGRGEDPESPIHPPGPPGLGLDQPAKGHLAHA